MKVIDLNELAFKSAYTYRQFEYIGQLVPLMRKPTHKQPTIKLNRPRRETLLVGIERTMLRLNFHRRHFPLQHLQLQSF